MENEEIVQLCKLKEELLKKAIHLKDKLKDKEDKRQTLINFDITLPSKIEDHKPLKPQSVKYKTKLCEIASQVTGITFKDINKKWLHNNTFIYTVRVITKTFSFNLELTVDFMHMEDFKIENIMCYFTDIDNCYMLEISPWFEKIISTKNFSLLMSALSDYSENNILRSKILDNLESRKYATIQQCTQENGGILVYMHSSINTEENYLIFQWTMKFLELTWHIEHFFIVKPTNIGIKFSEENRTLIREFCEISLTRNKLVELWDKLCIAIDNYTKDTDA